MSQMLQDLKTLSSAEDFFATLDVPFDPAIVNVARLHILKRMGQYLASESFDGLADDAVSARCKSTLERAYQDFVASAPIKERVFKVLREAIEPKPAEAEPAFVGFDELLK